MIPAVRFTNVSKQYRLGVTRTSLPDVIGRAIKRAAGHGGLPRAHAVHWALNDVTVDVGAGESIAVLGPNGAGKSTLLKLIAHVTEPTAGRVEVNGRVTALIELGAGFHPDLTGRENVYLNGAILGLSRPRIARSFDGIVAFAELDGFVDTPLKRYSSGMAVRLGFAVAACMDPEILLVDEVLAVGDAAFQRKCIDRIRELQAQGTTLIFISHNAGLIRAVCRTAVLLSEGSIVARGAVPAVLETYSGMIEARRAAMLDRRDAEKPHDAALEIARVDVVTASGEPADGAVGSGSAVAIRVSYVAYGSIGRAEGLVRIYRSDGTSCCVMRTADDGTPLHIERGRGAFTVTLDPVQLAAGTYYAVGWIFDDTGVNGLARGASDWFRVTGLGPERTAEDSVFEPVHRWSCT